jgi:YVTN family beta-propeller protein
MGLVAAGILVGGVLVAGGAWGQAKKTPKPGLVVLSKDENLLVIVDAATLQVVGKVPTGAVPHEVAVSDDGKYAVVTNYGAHANGVSLSVINLETQKAEPETMLAGVFKMQGTDATCAPGPHGVEFFGTEFYFTAEGCKQIGRLDAATNRVEWTHWVGQERTHMLVVAPDGKTIYTANVNSDSVTAVDLSKPAGPGSNTNIAVGKGPEGMDISPNGKEVWAANSGDGTVSVIDTGAKRVVGTIAVGTKHSNRLKFTPDGKLVLISDMGSGELVIVDAATRKQVKRLPLGKSAEGILVQPDGTRAFVAVSGDDKVAVVDLKTLTVTTTFAAGKDPDGLAWRK